MSSCSLELDWNSRPVMTVPDSVRQRGDYGNSSFFGSLHSDPSTDHGALVLAAAGGFGRGRVLVFSDSTVLSSFAVAWPGRSRLFLRGVDYLNRWRSPLADWFAWSSRFATAALVVAFLGCVAARGWAPAAVLALRAALAGSWVATRCNAISFRAPEPVRELPLVDVLLEPGEALLPPVLGNLGRLDPDWCYDTCVAAIGRIGSFARLSEKEALSSSGPLLWINPAHHLSPTELEALKRAVEAGKRLLVMVRNDPMHYDELAALLGTFGMEPPDLIQLVNGSGGTQWLHKPHGEGLVALLAGSEWLSRERLGHCFDVPGERERANLSAFLSALRLVASAEPIERRTYVIVEAG